MKPDDYTIGSAASLAEKWQFRELHLLADPSQETVSRYLTEGDMFVWRDADGGVIGEAVVDAAGEVKNLTVAPVMQGKGWGRRILDDLCDHYNGVFPALTVGTSSGGVAFDKKCGFRYSHTLCGFFTDNYPEPVFEEDGSPCRDMVILERIL